MRGRWRALGAVLVLATGCGEATSPAASEVETVERVERVARPTTVPAADGLVTTSRSVLVTDDGSGPHLCFSANRDFGGDAPSCDAADVTGWDWSDAGTYETTAGTRWGTFVLTGTFDGSTFAVEEVTQPAPDPFEWDYEIPCPTPAGGWKVLDPDRSGQDDLGAAMNLASGLDGYATGAVTTPDGQPGPRDPANTVFSVYVAGDPAAAESDLREVWGGMLCVTEVEHSHAELEKVQQALLDLPGWSEVGSGNLDNQVDLEVFHDDGTFQRWVDQEYGEGVVVVESNLQPVG